MTIPILEVSNAQLITPTLTDEEILERDTNEVNQIVPDCHREFIKAQLSNMRISNRAHALVLRLLDDKAYPKASLADKQRKHKNTIETLLNKQIDFDELLKSVPDPFSFYMNLKRNESESYKNTCRIYLENTYLTLSTATIQSLLTKYNYHLTPIYNAIKIAMERSKDKVEKARRSSDSRKSN